MTIERVDEPEADESLSLATVAQLIGELRRRHTAVLVVTDGEIGTEEGVDVTQVWIGGSRVHALGLAEWARQFLVTDAMDTALDMDMDADEEGDEG